MKKSNPLLLSIAASDSSAGAGIQADLKTCQALGVYAMTAVTAITAQNTQEIVSVNPVRAVCLFDQLEALKKEFVFPVIKIGALVNEELTHCVAEFLLNFPGEVVADTVLSSSSGQQLLSEEGLLVFKEKMIPRSSLITPNLIEAGILLGCSQDEILKHPTEACHALAALGAERVLLKGGHRPDESCVDFYYDGARMSCLEGARIHTKNTHGTGCTLSTAIGAFRVLGGSWFESVTRGKAYCRAALWAGKTQQIGNGTGPLNHLIQSEILNPIT